VSETTSPLKFYGGPFSNFADSTIVLDLGFGAKSYLTVEHAFQAAKATTLEEHERVRHAPGPGYAKIEGRRITLRDDWEQVKYEIMLLCLREKFSIPTYKGRLLSTADRELQEDSPTDFVWGARNNGQNLLGKALMQIREELRTHDTRYNRR
jgi:N-glycosidase YbiA